MSEAIHAIEDNTRYLQQPLADRVVAGERYARCSVAKFRRKPVSKEDQDLQKLMPSFRRLQRNEVWEYSSCPICLADFYDGEELRRTPCDGQHAFHPKCLRNWLDLCNKSCPVCRGGDDALAGEKSPNRPGNGPSPESMTEYVMTRWKSRKVDFTISARNQEKAAAICKLVR
mmetsp:Transcript_87376/g.182848  ORF Transcript_87376/g.182848 Transcript_87376/m.182848 type:complete len:172 (+) Transcript_87376:184-699(+)